MPAVAEPPKPAAPNIIQQIAMSGKSPADAWQESGGKEAQTPEGGKPENFNADLAAAQARDKGKSTPAAPAAAAPAEPAAPATPPKVPGLPAAQPQEEWKPRGETAKHFETLKTKHQQEIAARDLELQRIKTELDTAKLNGSVADVDALKKELKEYKETLRDVAIERDPEFRQRFTAKENAAFDAIKLAAGEKSEQVEKLLKLPSSPWRDEQLSKIADGLTGSSQRRFNAGLQVLEQVDVERSAEIATRRANFEQRQLLTQSQQREQSEAMQKQMQAEFQSVHQEWSKAHPFFTEIEGDKEHNERVAQARELSKHIFSGSLDPKELATAAHWAATGPLALEGWKNALKRAEAAEAALDKMRGVDPGEGRQTGVEGGNDNQPLPHPGTTEGLRYFNARIKEAQMKDAQTRMGRK